MEENMEGRKGKFPEEENDMSKYILKYTGGSDLELGTVGMVLEIRMEIHHAGL